jgi:phosphoglycolate phosphatase
MASHSITSVVYIGDTQGDLEAAEKAGIPFIFAAYGFGEPERWAAKIEHFSQLEEIL